MSQIQKKPWCNIKWELLSLNREEETIDEDGELVRKLCVGAVSLFTVLVKEREISGLFSAIECKPIYTDNCSN